MLSAISQTSICLRFFRHQGWHTTSKVYILLYFESRVLRAVTWQKKRKGKPSSYLHVEAKLHTIACNRTCVVMPFVLQDAPCMCWHSAWAQWGLLFQRLESNWQTPHMWLGQCASWPAWGPMSSRCWVMETLWSVCTVLVSHSLPQREATTGHVTQKGQSFHTSHTAEKSSRLAVVMVETLSSARSALPCVLLAVLEGMKAGLLNICWYVYMCS